MNSPDSLLMAELVVSRWAAGCRPELDFDARCALVYAVAELVSTLQRQIDDFEEAAAGKGKRRRAPEPLYS